jgi:hypothetical protein
MWNCVFQFRTQALQDVRVIEDVEACYCQCPLCSLYSGADNADCFVMETLKGEFVRRERGFQELAEDCAMLVFVGGRGGLAANNGENLVF